MLQTVKRDVASFPQFNKGAANGASEDCFTAWFAHQQLPVLHIQAARREKQLAGGQRPVLLESRGPEFARQAEHVQIPQSHGVCRVFRRQPRNVAWIIVRNGK